MVGLAVGVVVAVYPPNSRQVKDKFQFLFEWSLCLQVTQKYDRCRAMHEHGLGDEFEVSVYVSAKENVLRHVLHPL